MEPETIISICGVNKSNSVLLVSGYMLLDNLKYIIAVQCAGYLPVTRYSVRAVFYICIYK